MGVPFSMQKAIAMQHVTPTAIQ